MEGIGTLHSVTTFSYHYFILHDVLHPAVIDFGTPLTQSEVCCYVISRTITSGFLGAILYQPYSALVSLDVLVPTSYVDLSPGVELSHEDLGKDCLESLTGVAGVAEDWSLVSGSYLVS